MNGSRTYIHAFLRNLLGILFKKLLRGKSQNQVAKIINRYVFSLLQLIKNAWKVRCLRLPQRLFNIFNLPAPVHFFKLN